MSSEPHVITVAVLEDNRWERAGIVRDLASAGDIRVIGDTDEPGKFYDLVLAQQPDVVIVDLIISDDDRAGLKMLERLRHAGSTTRTIVLSHFPNLARFVAALDRGAAAFVSKEMPESRRPDLAAIVRMLVAGGTYYDGSLVLALRLHLDLPSEKLLEADANRLPPLSPAERVVLAGFAQGLSYQALAAARSTSVDTIKSQLTSIRNKFGVQKTQQAVALARFLGMLND